MNRTEVVIGSALKIVCSREEFAQKLAVVGRGVSTRASVQILSGILVRGVGGKLELAATDMELSIRTSLDAQVEGDGAVVVPGRLLVDLSRLLPESEVTIEHREEENILHVQCGSAEYRLNTYGAEDFPRLPEIESGGSYTLDAGTLLETLASVGRAVSRDEARPVLTGILVKFGEGKLVMAATDSYRLSY
jgi:DNA polymerase-3 subunit beta